MIDFESELAVFGIQLDDEEKQIIEDVRHLYEPELLGMGGVDVKPVENDQLENTIKIKKKESNHLLNI